MYTYLKQCRRFAFFGNEIMKIYGIIPKFDKQDKINKFYFSLWENFSSFCEKSIYPKICKEFEKLKSESNLKNFKKMTVKAEFTVAVCNEKTACVKIQLYSKDGLNSEIKQYDSADFWDMKKEVIVPPCIAVKNFFPHLYDKLKSKNAKKAAALYTDGKNIFYLDRNIWKSNFDKKYTNL